MVVYSLFLQLHLYLKIICNKKVLKYSIVGTIILSISQIILNITSIPNGLYFFVSMSVMIILPILIEKKKFIKPQIKYILLITLENTVLI